MSFEAAFWPYAMGTLWQSLSLLDETATSLNVSTVCGIKGLLPGTRRQIICVSYSTVCRVKGDNNSWLESEFSGCGCWKRPGSPAVNSLFTVVRCHDCREQRPVYVWQHFREILSQHGGVYIVITEQYTFPVSPFMLSYRAISSIHCIGYIYSNSYCHRFLQLFYE